MAEIIPFPEPPDTKVSFDVDAPTPGTGAHFDVVIYEGAREVSRWPVMDEDLPELQEALNAFSARFAPAEKSETA
jgi:hypothetical protein